MFYVMGEGWSGKFTFHINTDHPYHLRWRSVHHRHNAIQFQTFKSADDLEQFTDGLDADFNDYEPMWRDGSVAAAAELDKEVMENNGE